MIKLLKTLFIASLRDKLTLFWSVFSPIILLMILGYVIESPQYHERLLSGVIGMSILFMGLYTIGFEVLSNRNIGIFKLLRITPLSTSQFILCSSLSRTIYSIVSSYLTILIGVIFFDISVNIYGVLLLLPILFVGILGFMFLGFVVGNIAQFETQVSMYANIFGLPMLFLSQAFYKVTEGPLIVVYLSKVNPFEYFIQLIHLTMSGQFNTSILLPSAVIIVFAIISIILAVVSFRWDSNQRIGIRLNKRKQVRQTVNSAS